jgi:hypothetical protein
MKAAAANSKPQANGSEQIAFKKAKKMLSSPATTETFLHETMATERL